MIANDGFGRMTTYTRFAGAVVTEYREDGYYFAHPIHTSAGGHSEFAGPYETRDAAKEAEAKAIKRRRR